jgi:hypothetical protein
MARRRRWPLKPNACYSLQWAKLALRACLLQKGAMQLYLDIFTALAAARAVDLSAQHGLVIKAGSGLDAAILKVLRPEWTTDAPEQFINSNGLFFSVWIDAAGVAQKRARYNLHARKLRALKGETFPAREFARSFRAEAAETLRGWPSASFPKGPITLFEGHIRLEPKTLQADTSALVDRFVAMVPMLDSRLAALPATPA